MSPWKLLRVYCVHPRFFVATTELVPGGPALLSQSVSLSGLSMALSEDGFTERHGGRWWGQSLAVLSDWPGSTSFALGVPR